MPPLFAVSTRFILAGRDHGRRRLAARRHDARDAAGVRLVRADRLPAPGSERGALLRRAGRADRARLAPDRLGAALGRRPAPAARRAAAAAPALAGVGVGFAGVAILLQPGGGATTTGVGLCLLSAVMWSLGSFASARLTMPENAFAATVLGDARRRPRDAAVRARLGRVVLAVDLLDPRLALPRHDRLGRRLHRLHLAARERAARARLHLRLRQPGRRDPARRPLPQRAR